MTISDPDTGEIVATGRTDLNGTLVEDTGYRWVYFFITKI